MLLIFTMLIPVADAQNKQPPPIGRLYGFVIGEIKDMTKYKDRTVLVENDGTFYTLVPKLEDEGVDAVHVLLNPSNNMVVGVLGSFFVPDYETGIEHRDRLINFYRNRYQYEMPTGNDARTLLRRNMSYNAMVNSANDEYAVMAGILYPEMAFPLLPGSGLTPNSVPIDKIFGFRLGSRYHVSSNQRRTLGVYNNNSKILLEARESNLPFTKILLDVNPITKEIWAITGTYEAASEESARKHIDDMMLMYTRLHGLEDPIDPENPDMHTIRRLSKTLITGFPTKERPPTVQFSIMDMVYHPGAEALNAPYYGLGGFQLGDSFNAKREAKRIVGSYPESDTFVLVANGEFHAFSAFVVSHTPKSKRIYSIAGANLFDDERDAKAYLDELALELINRYQSDPANLTGEVRQWENGTRRATLHTAPVEDGFGAYLTISDSRYDSIQKEEARELRPPTVADLINTRIARRMEQNDAKLNKRRNSEFVSPKNSTTGAIKIAREDMHKWVDMDQFDADMKARLQISVVEAQRDSQGTLITPRNVIYSLGDRPEDKYRNKSRPRPRPDKPPQKDRVAARPAQPVAPPADGEFAFSLGDKFRPTGDERKIDLPNGTIMYILQPMKPISPFTTYSIFITPKSRTVFKITAAADIEKDGQAKAMVERWTKKIASKTGSAPTYPNNDKETIRFSKDTQTIQIKLSQETKNSPHRFEIQYLDTKLERRAKLERPRR
jgi:hypothetical protein